MVLKAKQFCLDLPKGFEGIQDQVVDKGIFLWRGGPSGVNSIESYCDWWQYCRSSEKSPEVRLMNLSSNVSGVTVVCEVLGPSGAKGLIRSLTKVADSQTFSGTFP